MHQQQHPMNGNGGMGYAVQFDGGQFYAAGGGGGFSGGQQPYPQMHPQVIYFVNKNIVRKSFRNNKMESLLFLNRSFF
jgi:hypothetical protein